MRKRALHQLFPGTCAKILSERQKPAEILRIRAFYPISACGEPCFGPASERSEAPPTVIVVGVTPFILKLLLAVSAQGDFDTIDAVGVNHVFSPLDVRAMLLA